MQTIKNVAFTEGRNRSQDFRLTPGVMQVSAAKRLKNSAQGEAERAIDRDKPPPNGRARIYSSRASRKALNQRLPPPAQGRYGPISGRTVSL
jgi:hypothetical protein